MTELEELQENSKNEIGTNFKYNNIELEIVKFKYCSSCALIDLECDDIKCIAHERDDNKNVMYVEYTDVKK